jgi:phosphoglycolate phosphatase-like HAD superfamily hydrolase
MADQDLRAGVLLDVDGTLLDTNYLHALAWWQAMRDAGVEGISMTDTHQSVGIANEQLVEHLAADADEKTAKKIIKAHTKRYAKLQKQVVAFDRAAELITRCQESGLAVVLATSGQASDLDWMLPAIGIEKDSLSGVTTSADVEVAKPAPDLLAHAMQQHGLDPDRTIAIGDTVWDIRSAHDAGLRIIAVTCGGIPRCQLRENGADEIYSGPADLLDHWSGSALATLG